MKTSKFLPKIFLLISLAISHVFISCNDDEGNFEESMDIPGLTVPAKQTVFMYLPWSGSGLYYSLRKNIEAFESAIENNHGTDGNALIVFISQDNQKSNLIRIYYRDGESQRDTLKQYDFSSCDYTEAEGIAEIINDAKAAAPAEKYAMAIGCHGTGWIPVGTNVGTRAAMINIGKNQMQQTRYFGTGIRDDNTYQTDIATLAEGIRETGTTMEYVLFDDCYMSNIEIAYELKDVTKHLIASTCEIMDVGMPYERIGISLLKNNYKDIVDGFYDYYSNFSTPCGTIGVTDCREVEYMAYIMQQINAAYPDLQCDITDIQDLDGFENTIFFDFGDYVSNLCSDPSLLALFNDQLERLVIYKANTETYYTSMYIAKQYPINAFSGITISDPSINKSIANVKPQTNWYKDTH